MKNPDKKFVALMFMWMIIALIIAVIAITILFPECAKAADAAPYGMRWQLLKWDAAPHTEGYKLHITTYYSADRSLKVSKTIDVGNVTQKKVLIHDLDVTHIVNVCYQISAYGSVTPEVVAEAKAKGLAVPNEAHTYQSIESDKSEQVCERPWPPKNIHVK